MNRRGFFAGVGAALATLAGADKLAKALEPVKPKWSDFTKLQPVQMKFRNQWDGGYTVPKQFYDQLLKLQRGKPIYGKPLIIKEGVRYEKVPDGIQPVDYCYALNAIAG